MNELIGQGVGAIIGTGMDIMSENRAQARYRRNQDVQNQHEASMMQRQYDLNMKQWEETNYKAQIEQMRKAGLNPALMYKSAGQGGTTGNISSSPRQAPNLPSYNSGAQMAIEMGMAQSQIELNRSQAEKNKAEAENLQGGVRDNLTEDRRAKKFTNDINELYREQIEEAKNMEWDMTKIKGEEANAAWEFKKAIEYGVKPEQDGPFTNDNTRAARAKIAEMKMFEEDLKRARIENNIAEAEKIIKEFEAEMTKQGISPNSPWYAKLLTDLLQKVGILDLIGVGQKALKNQITK